MEVQIVSRGCIKPSSSTPSHLKTYKISLLDQFMPPVLFYSIALFYPNTTTHTNSHDFISQRSFLLKQSLSKTLSHFYPLAGRIQDHLSIDCNDEGAYYAEARANVSIQEYLTQPDHTVMKKWVPDVSSFNQNPIGAFVVMIQETTFSCGGLAIGLSVSHMALDGTALASFIKAWAASAAAAAAALSSCRGDEIMHPNFDSPSVFPQSTGFPNDATFVALWGRFARREKVTLRRLMFDASHIDKLKSEAASTESVENPSRVEVVSAIICKSVKAALNAKSIAVGHAVNMRRKAPKPFPNCSIGNFVWPVHPIFRDKESQLSSLVYQTRSAIRKIDKEFVENVVQGGFSKLCQEVKDMGNELSADKMELMLFTSWCNFGLYNDSDFGWGKPIWISQCSMNDGEEMPFCNSGILNDTRSGKGVEAWLYLYPDVAAFLDKDDELLQHASVNPCPSILN